mgnify:CR=1 FL=1|jgi:hypothetical protein
MIFNLSLNENRIRIGIFSSNLSRKLLLEYLIKYFDKKKYKIYDYKLNLDIVDTIKLYNYKKIKKNEIILARIIRPVDFILVNKNIRNKENIISFISGYNSYIPKNFYDYIFYEKEHIHTKGKLRKIYKLFLIEEIPFEKWWSNLKKKWIIIRTIDHSYYQIEDISNFFEINNVSKKIFSFEDYLFDYYN